jgi:hypothetical protein
MRQQMMKLPPRLLFKMNKPESAIALEPGMIEKVLGRKRVIKIDDTGLIVVNIKNDRYGFQLYDQLFINHKNSRIIVRFDDENLKEVCIYDFKNDNFISSVKQILVWTRDNPDVYYRHIGKVRKIVRLMKEYKEADEALISETPKGLPDFDRYLTKKLFSNERDLNNPNS